MSSKSEKRLESKKRKAAAFIRLIESDEAYKLSKESQESSSEEHISKKLKFDDQQVDNTDESQIHIDVENGKTDEIAEVRKFLKQRQKAAMQKPKLFLTLDEMARDDPIQCDCDDVRKTPPLFITDVQHLLLHPLLGGRVYQPRWCRLLRPGKVSKVVVVVLDSLSSAEFKKFPESLPTLVQGFDGHIEIVSPDLYGSSVREDLMNVPMSNAQVRNVHEQGKIQEVKSNLKVAKKPPKFSKPWENASLIAKWATEIVKIPLESLEVSSHGEKTLTPKLNECTENDLANLKETEKDSDVSLYELDKFDRRWLMLNSSQMILEGVPTPSDNDNVRYKGYVFTKEQYKEVTEKSPMYAIDCEMVITKASKMDLARVSLIDEHLDVIYDTYVKPRAPVLDYVTRFSGITKQILDPITIRLEDVQQTIRKYLPADAILCGQSICSDLSSMKLFHPYLIDTSVIYNLTGKRQMKTSLKKLSAMFLSREIQKSKQGHSSVEDAQATMELVQLKLRNSPDFGNLYPATTTFISSMDIPDTCNGNSWGLSSLNGGNCEHSNTGSSLGKCESCGSVHCRDMEKQHAFSKTDNKKKQAAGEIDVNSFSHLCRTAQKSGCRNLEREKRRLFFQQNRYKFMESFLHKIAKVEKKGVIIDVQEKVSLYPTNQMVHTCIKDKDCVQKTINLVSDVDFSLTHLYGFRDILSKLEKCSEQIDEQKKKDRLWKLDRMVWKIMLNIPKNSLFVVILTGREEGQGILPAMAFVKICD